MSAISLKSITGITSITTPAGVDNVFTVHTNDTTERFRIDQSGNQRIAGILTVTQNLDVGNNIKVGSGVTITPAGAGFYAGIITATSYRGDGSQLTGIIGVTINNNTNNRLVTATGTTGTLDGEANLNFDGTALGINISSPSAPLEIRGAGGTNDAAIYFRRDGSPPNDAVIGQLLFRKGTDSVAIIQAKRESALDDAYIQFQTQPTGGNVTERLRITSGGNVRVTSGVIENAKTISSNYTVSTDYNAMSAGPMSVANGVSVTVPSGSAWTIV